MQIQSEAQLSSQVSGAVMPVPARRSALLNRVPRRSVCHVHHVALTDEALDDGAYATSSVDVWQHEKHQSPISVAAFPASDQACRFYVFVDCGSVLKKLDLPSTARVETRQKFVALAYDKLLFNCAAILCHGTGRNSPTAGVSAILSCVDTGQTVLLFGRSVSTADNSARERGRINLRESVSFKLPLSGNYELRLVAAVDPNSMGCETNFLVNSVRVADSEGYEVKQLASLSCAGRVRT